jgi:hypothetical protein
MLGGIFVVLGVAAACGKSSDDDSTPATGGSSGKGGSSATGGAKASGGTGGAKSTGGTTSTGGSSSELGGATGDDTGGTGAKGGTGGTTSTGGTGGTGDPVTIDSMCDSFKACGGDVVGTWKPNKLCSSSSGMDEAGGAAGLPDCAANTAMSMASSDALYTFKSDGTYSVTGSLTLNASFTIDDACAMEQQVPDAAAFCEYAGLFGGAGGFDLTCKMSGAVCGCAFGTTQDQDSSGTYTLDGDSISIDQTTGSSNLAVGANDYCVKGNTLTLSNAAGEQVALTRQ